jgi:hypothetical protein
LKIGLILLAAFWSLWSIEAGMLTFYLAKLDLFWPSIFCITSSILGFILFDFGVKQLRNFLERWPTIKSWLIKAPSKDNYWVKCFYRHPRLGLYVGGGIPLIGIPVQKIFRLKYGFWFLLSGHITKIAIYILVLYLAH